MVNIIPSPPGPPEVARTGLVQAVIDALQQHPIALVIAPPVSGKATLVRQFRSAIAALGDDLSVRYAENLDSLDSDERSSIVREIEATAASGQRWLATSADMLPNEFVLNRMRDHVVVFGLPELALTDAEVCAFLGLDLTDRLPERMRRSLLERTAGWIGAWMVLRALLRDSAMPTDTARAFSGLDRDLADYFDTYVMPRLAPRVAQLLLDSAPLRDITEDTARAATGEADVSSIIRDAVRDCAFVTDVDRDGARQRLHPLFRQYLELRARRFDPQRKLQLTALFAGRAADHGDWLEAARLYSDAGDVDSAIEILRQFASDLITGRGEVASFRHLVASLPKDAVHMSSIAGELALGAIFSGDFAGAAALVDVARNVPDLASDDQARLEAISISTDFGIEFFQRVRSEAPLWLDRHPRIDPRYRVIVAVSLFWSCLAEGDSSGAYRAVGFARTEVNKARAPFLKGWLQIVAGVHKLTHGQMTSAAELLDSTVASGTISRTIDMVRAAVAYEQGEIDLARWLVGLSLQAGLRHSVVETSLLGWGTAARLAMRDDGLMAALNVLMDAETSIASRHGERARRLVRLLRAVLILQSPGDAMLSSLVAELDALSNDPVAHQLCPSYIETARLALARYNVRSGDVRRAIMLVQPIQSAALRVNRIGCWGEASIIQAGALARRGDVGRALRQAWSTIAAMTDAGHLSSITDEHILLAPIIDELVYRANDQSDRQSPAMVDAIHRLAHRAGRHPLSANMLPTQGEAPAASVMLTDTERRVLALAANGLANAEIAMRMSIGVTTVKWHLKNIYLKLSVKSRTAAFVQARRLGLDI